MSIRLDHHDEVEEAGHEQDRGRDADPLGPGGTVAVEPIIGRGIAGGDARGDDGEQIEHAAKQHDAAEDVEHAAR